MSKAKIAGLIAGGLFLAAPFTALAAADLTFITFDGHANVSVEQGDDVEAKTTYDITSSTDVESLSWELVGSDLPETCVNIQDRIADGTFTTEFDIDTTGASEGTWDVRVRLFGDNGPDASNLCEDTDSVDSQLFTDRITVEDNTDDNQNDGDDDDGNVGSSGGGSGSGSNGLTSSIDALIALITKLLAGGTVTPVPTTPTVNPQCTLYNTSYAHVTFGSTGPQVAALQSFLMAHGHVIPLISSGAAAPGYYGAQTAQAVAAFKVVNSCAI